MKKFVRILVCVAIAGTGLQRISHSAFAAVKAAAKAEHKPSGKKADAKTLVADARKALAAMVKAARADAGLNPKTPKNKPYWKSVHQVATQLDAAQKGLAAKNDDFFKAVTKARAAEEQMKIDWELTDSKNMAVIANGKKLGNAIELLRTKYSKEAARKKKGGQLTAEEKAQFEKIKAQQKELLAKLKALEPKAKKDPALAKGLKEMQHEAAQIAKKPNTVDAYVSSLYLLDSLNGKVKGYSYYVDKPLRSDWVYFDKWANTYDTAWYDYVDDYGYAWTDADVATDIYVDDDVDVTDSIPDSEVDAQEDFAEAEPADMTDAEEDQVAEAEDSDADADSDDDSMDDDSNDDGDDDGDADGDDDGGDDDGGDDDGGDDDGGDDGGE